MNTITITSTYISPAPTRSLGHCLLFRGHETLVVHGMIRPLGNARTAVIYEAFEGQCLHVKEDIRAGRGYQTSRPVPKRTVKSPYLPFPAFH